MPKTVHDVFCVAALLIANRAEAQTRKADPTEKKNTLIGTWERTDLPAQYRQVKTYSDTHFTWVAYLAADGNVAAVGGGTYTFDGKTCKEKYVYGSGNINAFIKQEPPAFTIKFQGDGWVQDGKAPNGAMLHEVYRRAK